MVHDSAGFAAAPAGGTRENRPAIRTLRLTRDLEPGFAVTIEPGIYFIDSLLEQARADGRGDAIDWKRVEAIRPWGGIRIEDDVIAQAGAPRNLTREAFAAA
jgi:Xaa-Pro dipeptidase